MTALQFALAFELLLHLT